MSISPLARTPDEFARLVSIDVFRDGGSYEARFETACGELFAIWLERSKMPDADGLHHRELYVADGRLRDQDLQPIMTGSPEEQDLLHLLEDFAARAASQSDPGSLAHLAQLIGYIRRRDPLFSSSGARRPPPGWPG